jgi:hypothetical protein
MPGSQTRSFPLAGCWRHHDGASRRPSTPTKTDPTRETTPRDRYARARDLPRLIGLWPWEIQDQTLAGHERLLKLLRRALRLERQRGLAGHWTYDLARHASLLNAYRCELANFREARARDRRPAIGGGLVFGPEPASCQTAVQEGMYPL